MDIIYNLFPTDLAAIVEAYSSDRTKYDQVLIELSDFHIIQYYSKKSVYVCIKIHQMGRLKIPPRWMIKLKNNNKTLF